MPTVYRLTNPTHLLPKLAPFISLVAEAFGIHETLVYGKSRRAEATWTRFVVWKIFRDEYSLATLGAIFNRDHSTVINGLRVFDSICQAYPQVRKVYDTMVSLSAAVINGSHIITKKDEQLVLDFNISGMDSFSFHFGDISFIDIPKEELEQILTLYYQDINTD